MAIESRSVTAQAPLEDGRSAALEVRAITKAFGRVEALRGASLQVHRGEVVALAGDNGAGKSTLIKIMSGILRPDGGEVWCDGHQVSMTRPQDAGRLGIETVYQDLALCDNLDVVENVFLGREDRWPSALLGRLQRAGMERRARDALNALGVNIASLDTPVGGLSGGQRQCTAVCRAMVADPNVLIFDEPTAALGVRQTREVLTLISRLREQGKGVLIVSHDLVEVLRIADRIAVLRLGKVVATGSRAEWSEHSLVSAITGASGLETGGESSVS